MIVPELCCLLGLCCPPEERRLKIAGWLSVAMGTHIDAAFPAADALIYGLDAHPFVHQLKALVGKAHGA